MSQRKYSSTPKSQVRYNDQETKFTCKGCKKVLGIHIRKHLHQKPQCKESYDQQGLKLLDDEIKLMQKINKKQNNKYYYDLKTKNSSTVQCKGCERFFSVSGIKNHIRKVCFDAYSELDMMTLNEIINAHKSEVKKTINARHRERQKDSRKLDDFQECLDTNKTYEFCLACRRSFEISKILKHLTHQMKCKEKYSQQAYDSLVKKCNKFKEQVKKINREKNLQEDKSQ